MALTAVCGYGFVITHPTIGIDDTAMELYLHEGYMVGAVCSIWLLGMRRYSVIGDM